MIDWVVSVELVVGEKLVILAELIMVTSLLVWIEIEILMRKKQEDRGCEVRVMVAEEEIKVKIGLEEGSLV